MEVTALSPPDLMVLTPKRFCDRRGFFSECYNKKTLAAVGINIEFVQDNHSLSMERGTIRGLHFQAPPFAQDKLVYVMRGSVLDIAVDLRLGSPTYGQHAGVILSAEQGNQIFVPKGFAHGFCTLESATEVVYKVSDYYSPEHDMGLLWKDPGLGIKWPVGEGEAIIADKDLRLPNLRELSGVFTYGRD